MMPDQLRLMGGGGQCIRGLGDKGLGDSPVPPDRGGALIRPNRGERGPLAAEAGAPQEGALIGPDREKSPLAAEVGGTPKREP